MIKNLVGTPLSKLVIIFQQLKILNFPKAWHKNHNYSHKSPTFYGILHNINGHFHIDKYKRIVAAFQDKWCIRSDPSILCSRTFLVVWHTPFWKNCKGFRIKFLRFPIFAVKNSKKSLLPCLFTDFFGFLAANGIFVFISRNLYFRSKGNFAPFPEPEESGRIGGFRSVIFFVFFEKFLKNSEKFA